MLMGSPYAWLSEADNASSERWKVFTVEQSEVGKTLLDFVVKGGTPQSEV
jgi:hypothetical protein